MPRKSKAVESIPAPAAPAVPTFRELAVQVLELRDHHQGIRGIGRERSRYRVHIADAAFADRPITEIVARDIREWLRVMQDREVRPKGKAQSTGKKLDRKTINRAQSLVSAVFVEALERDIITVNPCHGVKPKKRVDESDTVEGWTFLTVPEQERLWACAAPRHILLAMMIAAGTGMRPCEQFNMRLPDFVVDGDEPHVNIRLSHPYKGKDAPPKNGKMRKVPLMAGRTLDAAREWLAMLPTFAPSNPLDLVFPTARGCRRQQGKWLGRSVATREIYDLANIPHRPHLNFYALRHTFASNLVSGVLGRFWHLPEIQVLMGHSSVTITQMYAHLGEDAIRRAVREANAATLAATAIAVVAPPELVREAWYRAVWAALIAIIRGRANKSDVQVRDAA